MSPVNTACRLLAGWMACTAALAQPADAPPPMTWELLTNNSELSAGLPDGHAWNLRASVGLPRGDVLNLELLEETKFGAHGGVAAVGYTAVLSPDWYLVQTLVGGQGGPNWANVRVDTQISRKWLAQRQLVTSAALYWAWFDNARSDAGLRLGLAWYLPVPAVLEAGITFNVSQPGRVHSRMPFASVTLGRERSQYLSLRYSEGTEAYQALGDGAQLVDFRSRSIALNWRRWIGRDWGFSAQAEHYRNPSYMRRTLGAGVFVQW